ncbi:MAG TPA: AMP-binding protein [Burkholderiales bacterium]|nr:AMP-binding protein [Burkholderiales bacterium]
MNSNAPSGTLTLSALLAARAATAGGAPMLVDRGRPIAFAEIAAESRRVATAFARLGIGREDRVALWLPNVSAWLTCFFACAQLGAIAVSVNTRFRAQEVADIVGRSGARLLVYWPGFKGIDFSAILTEVAEAAPTALAGIEALIAYAEAESAAPHHIAGRAVHAYGALAGELPRQRDDATPDAGCILFTTSGTTKAPKFVLHDQRAVVAHAHDVARGFGLDADAVMLLVPPLCGVFGFCCAMGALAAGRPLVMRPAWDAAQAAADIAAQRVTHANATDEAIAQLLAHSRTEPAFPSVRFFGYASFNPSLDDIVERAAARDLTLVGLYGASEVQALFARQDENAPLAERGLAGGRPVNPAARVRVCDPESGRVLPHGEAGELEFFSANSRMVGYFGNPQATHAALSEDGFYRSGDLGYTTADGRFVFLARMGDSLRLGGFLVSPLEIEAVVQQAPGIAACQVVGVPGAAGLVAVAFVILAPGATLDEAALRAHVGARLARFKVPQRIVPLEAFPVTPGANATKIQKGKLREMAQALLAP